MLRIQGMLLPLGRGGHFPAPDKTEHSLCNTRRTEMMTAFGRTE